MLGSSIETKRCALTWHYRQADPEQGIHMANACYDELESGVARNYGVEVMRGKANLEVRPNFINKGEIVKRLVSEFHRPDAPLEFVFCVGDDFTDEDMFRALNGVSRSMLADDHIFTVTVGASTKSTLARWHLLEPEDVVDCGALVAGVGAGGEAIRTMGQVNIATLSTVEDHIPQEVS
jgi:trehalose 6-phosphate synthase/phosphatase